MSMKQRQFDLDAWELCRRFGQPGSQQFAEECLKFGYSLGLHDATAAIRHANDKVAEKKARSNQPS